MDNVLTQIGDTLTVNVRPLITGRIRITGFTEDISGESTTCTLQREFRISATDEIFWSGWKPLTVENLSAEEYFVDRNSVFIVQVRYTRGGTDETSIVTFRSIKFDGDITEWNFDTPTLNSSIFASVFGTEEMQQLEENLFKKLYYRGILPAYITRAENNDEAEDRDFIDLFFSVARFFSMFIIFFKRFESFGGDFDLMREQVRQYGIYFDESNITLEELQYLAQNIFDQIRQRGTLTPFLRRGDGVESGKVMEIDGELMRLLRSGRGDEMLIENVLLENMGWCMRRSSPLYRGTGASYMLNKTGENSADFVSLDDFVISAENRDIVLDGGYSDTETWKERVDCEDADSTYSAAAGDRLYNGGVARDNGVTIVNDGGRRVLDLVLSLGSGATGLGRPEEVTGGEMETEKLIVVDPRVDYEITFAVKVKNTAENTHLLFGVEGFNSRGEWMNDAFMLPNGDGVSETFDQIPTTFFKNGEWYYIRGILFAYSSTPQEHSPLNISRGNNLIFNNPFTAYILPRIQLTGTGPMDVEIWDYKIRPLVRGTNILPLRGESEGRCTSMGFIEAGRFFYSYIKNNNNSLSSQDITRIIDKYFTPYNMTTISVITNRE